MGGGDESARRRENARGSTDRHRSSYGILFSVLFPRGDKAFAGLDLLP